MEDKIDAKYICNICKSVLNNATALECSHTFCYDCIQSLSLKGHKTCPNCKKAVDLNHRTELWSLDQEIKSTEITCPTCKRTITLDEYNKHEEQCGLLQPVQGASRMVINPTQLSKNRFTFSCPICSAKNLPAEALREHVLEAHKNEKSRSGIVCPICAAMPWGDKNQQSGNFIEHINLRHKFEYERFVDMGKDDEEQLKVAIEQSKVDF